jgi:hypothetical protein
MNKIKEQLAGVAALIGVLVAIGGGFIKYGEVMTRMSQMEESLKNYQPFNPDPLVGEMGKQSATHRSVRKNKSNFRTRNQGAKSIK